MSETPPIGQTGNPRGQSVTSAVQDPIEVATTVILWSEPINA